jgi:hypothetical protein
VELENGSSFDSDSALVHKSKSRRNPFVGVKSYATL